MLALFLLQLVPLPAPTPLEVKCEQWANMMVQTGVMEDCERDRYFTVRDYFLEEQNETYFDDSVAIMIMRMDAMKPDTPLAIERYRFPPVRDCLINRQLAYLYDKWLTDRMVWATWNEKVDLERELADCKKRYKVWDLLLDLQNNYGADGRRLILQELRKLLGEKDFNSATVPDPLTPAAYYWGFE